MKQHLLDSGVDRAYVRRMTERLDNLRLPLKPNREASIRDDRDTVLLRLLFCALPVSEDLALDALGPELLGYASRTGLLLREGTEFRSPFHLRYVKHLLLLSDYLTGDPDAVMGAGETTAILYQAARPHTAVHKALDLGCGAGTLALLLASDCETVIGTDINARASAFGAANAALNGIGNAEFRAGDMYDPVEGDRFDLIVSQPPYYPAHHSPHQTFLHGGVRGDELARKVLAGIPEHLEADGRALVFASWPDDSGPTQLADFDVLELHSSRKEVSGTRQSLNVFQRGRGHCFAFEVSGESWDLTDARRLDELFANEELLSGDDEEILRAEFRLPPGSVRVEEGDQIFLQCPDSELVGCVPLSKQDWSELQKACAGNGDPGFVRNALRRGILRVRASV